MLTVINGTADLALAHAALDDPLRIVRRLAGRILEAAGYTVLAAVDGVDALALLSKSAGTVALMVTDVRMTAHRRIRCRRMPPFSQSRIPPANSVRPCAASSTHPAVPCRRRLGLPEPRRRLGRAVPYRAATAMACVSVNVIAVPFSTTTSR